MIAGPVDVYARRTVELDQVFLSRFSAADDLSPGPVAPQRDAVAVREFLDSCGIGADEVAIDLVVSPLLAPFR